MNTRDLFVAGAVALGAVTTGQALLRLRRRMDFQNSSVVITGGSRGLGLLMARQLAREGARLTLLARDAAELEEAARELSGADVLVLVCDVANRSSLEQAIAETIRQRGRIDVLINNAGIMQVGPLEHVTVADFEEAMAVHFWAPLHATLAVVPSMIAQGGGRIVNISSVGGMVAVPHLAPYSASKFALTGLSDALRAELARQGVYVTTVCPGLMATGSHVNVTLKGKRPEEFTWFAIGAGAPLASMNARRAARQIVQAARYGRPSLRPGLPARILIFANAVAPSLIGEAMALVARLLPGPAPEGESKEGTWANHSRWAPSILTRRADRAAELNNELHGHSLKEFYAEA